MIFSSLARQVVDDIATFQNLGHFLPDVQKSGQKIVLEENLFPISDFVAVSSESYFTYFGSLTKPPCFNSITWIVNQQKIDVPKAFVSKEMIVKNLKKTPYKLVVYIKGQCH